MPLARGDRRFYVFRTPAGLTPFEIGGFMSLKPHLQHLYTAELLPTASALRRQVMECATRENYAMYWNPMFPGTSPFRKHPHRLCGKGTSD